MTEEPYDLGAEPHEPPSPSRLVDGSTWLRSGSATIEAVWGDATTVLAPRLQPTIPFGRSGAGKTTLGQRILLGTIGLPGFDKLLDYPVTETAGRALYLAADRPDQARLSLRRMVATMGWTDRKTSLRILRERLRVLPGPPPHAVNARPETLLVLAQQVGATFVLVDSLKDMARKLSEDDVGAGVNQAHQLLIAAGIDVVSLHHPRKDRAEQEGDRAPQVDDLYGSAWIGNGAGSILHLARGPITVTLTQVKAPLGGDATFSFAHDEPSGTLTRAVGNPLLEVLRLAGDEGCAKGWLARCVYRREEITAAEGARVYRELLGLQDAGLAEMVGKGREARWRVT